MSNTYNPWPIGKVPVALQRREPEMVRALGYHFDDHRELVTIFENKVAQFAGSKYAVAVDCCTHAIELSFRYLIHKKELDPYDTLDTGQVLLVPTQTYVSAALVPIHLGFYIVYDDIKWSGGYYYQTGIGFINERTRIFDGAVRWKRGMYEGNNSLHCLSFQIKKTIPIGRGGMILTDDKEAADWLKLASYDGRDLTLPYDHPDHVKMNGYHYYMPPECAARGILLMHSIKQEGDSADWSNYPDVKKMLKL